MQTSLPEQLLITSSGQTADNILRSCVHCGFCTATCPTYLITGNELDSPRGRIYLVKEMLEKGKASSVTRTHLESCLSCQACETTCPSDVHYHELLNIGRGMLASTVPASVWNKLKRKVLLGVLGSTHLFSFLVRLGSAFHFLLPASLHRQLPQTKTEFSKQDAVQSCHRKVVLLNGCVQNSLSPQTNRAAVKILQALQIDTVDLAQESCCGAMHYHSDEQEGGLTRARSLIDQIELALSEGAEAVVSTASGCGNFIKDFPSLFKDEALYKNKAEHINSKVLDISELLVQEGISDLDFTSGEPLVFHSPCTLQHGQKLGGTVEILMSQAGFSLNQVQDSHLCCGSAGTYSLFQPKMARELRDNKLSQLQAGHSNNIATANIGCQCHLASGTEQRVRHWIEYLAEALPASDANK
jgi:glycolate oxidase iron-sulfur subunit